MIEKVEKVNLAAPWIRLHNAKSLGKEVNYAQAPLESDILTI